MPQKKLPRKAHCPCGSGKKYGDCCYDMGFEYLTDEEGNIFKSIPMSGELTDSSSSAGTARSAIRSVPRPIALTPTSPSIDAQ